MALVPQEIPKVGLVMEAVTVLRWLKNVGDSVTAGEPLLEVESEKSVVEIEAAASGRLAEILVHADQPAAVGDRVAWLEVVGAPANDPPRGDVTGAVAPGAVAPGAQAPAPILTATAINDPVESNAVEGGRIRSTPVARKVAADHGVELGSIAGTGPGGRIQLKDVARSLQTMGVPESPGEGLPLSPMRRALARSMTLSNAMVPQFTVSRAVDWTDLQAARGALSAQLTAGAPSITVNDFLLQAIARVLGEFPALNATFSGVVDAPDARIVPANGAHIGLVVAVDHGLLVPVIHDVQRLGLAEIARRRQDCVERALKGRLKREESDGATFSISNLGAAGPDRFTAIINPPQSAILAVGRRRDCVVARDGGIAVRPMSDLTMTVDHRIADGRLASEFLARLVAVLESRDWRLR